MKKSPQQIDIPDELIEGLIKWNRKREHSEHKIKRYTDDWIEAQKNIIKIKDTIKVLQVRGMRE